MHTSPPLAKNDAARVAPIRFSRDARAAASDGTRGPVQMLSALGEARRVLPHPNGWFAVGFSHEVQRGTVRILKLMDRDLVAYRTQDGTLHVVEPYCPHMGAHLGHGGRVEGNDLVCPYHHLAFGPDGHCVRAGHGGTPPRAALTGRHVREPNGVIMVWVHHGGLAPDREPPTYELGAHCPPVYECRQMFGNFQNGGENSVDLVHFDTIHRFMKPEISIQVVDNVLEVDLSGYWKGYRFHGSFRNHDAGNQYADFSLPDFGIVFRTPAYCTPTTLFEWQLRWVSVPQIQRVDRWAVPLRTLFYAALRPVVRIWINRVLDQDYSIWKNRSYSARPRYMADDRHIAAYERWATQFYTNDRPVPDARPSSPQQGAAQAEGNGVERAAGCHASGG